MLMILFLTGLVAGTVDAIAGGGGLICLPMLLGFGVPPHIALGTNKLQSSVGTLVAAYSYYRARLFNFSTIYKGLIFGFLGAVLGAVTSQLISSDILKKIIPVLLVIIFLYTLFSPRLGLEDKKPLMNEFHFYTIFGFTLGFYDGFFGPATGSFWVFSLTCFLGYNLRKATAYTKIFNLKSNLIAAACFAIGGNIDYRIGLCMALGQLIGGRLGAYLAIRNGAKIIRPIFIAVVSGTIATLVYQSYLKTAKAGEVLVYLSNPALYVAIAGMITIVWYLKAAKAKAE
ncbi:MAG: TSUP family transporter [Gammaproteobacteria bacterium]